MKKLIRGIVEFRRNRQEGYREKFAGLALGQAPNTLFVACSDSRVIPNTFASTDPGDLFVVRNVGNLIPPCDAGDASSKDQSAAAAIEFSVLDLNISDIVICGHSECGAMVALVNDRSKLGPENLKSWLQHGDQALEQLRAGSAPDPSLEEHNQLSQLNVLLQMEHVKSYPEVKKRIADGTLAVHGWWFDIAQADVYAYDEGLNRFTIIDEEAATRLLSTLGASEPGT